MQLFEHKYFTNLIHPTGKNIYFEVDTSDHSIGEGGMGKVMKGFCVDASTKVSRPVAIKFLYDDLPTHAIERARREASIQLRNDNLIEMLGFIEVETGSGNNITKHYHVVSELLSGVSLSDIFEGKCANKDGKDIPFAQKLLKDYQTDPSHFAKYIVMNVLSGLIALHDAGYIHRDIDPSNIMITEDGHIKLIDFGIAKQVHKLTTNDRRLTTAGMFMGKAEYASPELAIGDLKHQDQTTDIYAIGILLYQCVVGHVPFEGPSHIVLQKQIKEKISLSVIKDRGLRKIIECATEKNQGVRYQTASQMRAALESLEGKKMQMKRSKKVSIGLAVSLFFLLIAVFLGVSYHKGKAQEEAAVLSEIMMNDSLKSEISEVEKTARLNMEIGEKHDEGYEQAFIKAYSDYSNAIEISKKIRNEKIDMKAIVQGKEKAKRALITAKEELDNKANEFEAEGMDDIAQEFHFRSKKIADILK